jgi:hypothetical protein
MCRCARIDRTTGLRCIRSWDPMPRLERSGCARRSGVQCFLEIIEQLSDRWYQGRCRTSLSVVYAGNVVHTSCDEEDAVWRPGKVVNLRAYRPAHGLDPPCLLVFETLFEVVRGVVLSWNPQQDVAIVAGAREHFAYKRLFAVLVCICRSAIPRGHHRTTFTACVCFTRVDR